MKTLKKDVIRELKRRKEIHSDPVILDYIKKAKTEEEIAMVLLRYYKTDVFAVCFETSSFPMYWKKWAIADYMKVFKKDKDINKEELMSSIAGEINSNTVNLFTIDLAIRDSFQNNFVLNEDFEKRLDSRESMHVHMLTILYEALIKKEEKLEKKIEELSEEADDIRNFRLAE